MIFFFNAFICIQLLVFEKKDPLQIPFNYFENVINNAQI